MTPARANNPVVANSAWAGAGCSVLRRLRRLQQRRQGRITPLPSRMPYRPARDPCGCTRAWLWASQPAASATGHAGDEPLPHRRGGGRGTRVEPGERLGRGAERPEQRGKIRSVKAGGGSAAAVGRGRVPPAREAQPIGVGLVLGVLPGRPEPVPSRGPDRQTACPMSRRRFPRD